MSLRTDLTFFFNNNLFIKSNFFSTMMGSTHISLAKIQGNATFNESYTDSELRKVRRYSNIANKYQQLSPLHRRMVASIFDHQYKYPPEFRQHISKYRNYDISGLLCFTSDSLENLLKQLRKSSNAPTFQTKIEKMYQELEIRWKNIT